MLSIVNPLDDVMVGNDAAWLLHFYYCNGDSIETIVEIGRDSYYANIQASLPSGLEGGIYKFDVEGLGDDVYGKIAPSNDINDGRDVFVDLYLYWRDTISILGYFKSLANLTDTLGGVEHNDIKECLVAKLAVKGISRKAGISKYNTIIEAREAVFHKAEGETVCGDQQPQLILLLAKSLAESASFKVQSYSVDACSSQDANQQMEADKSQSVLENLKKINNSLEQLTCKRGRGMFLIRDGILHIGVRPIPLIQEKEITESSGLIDVEALADVVSDPNFNRCKKDAKPPKRKQYKLTLKGRPDIKPGCVLKFDKPATEMNPVTGHWSGVYGDLAVAAVSGNLLLSLDSTVGNNAVRMYVSSVEHRLGKSSGFVTTVTGVTLCSEDDGWDVHTDRSSPNRENSETAAATPEQGVVNSTRRVIQREMNQYSFTEVAEVRAINVQDQDEVSGQTETLWRGLVNEDGLANQSRRLDVRHPSQRPAQNTPYLSPFAWGKCGLVLPRYPGMRVVTSHRQALSSDPIDIGALWKSGEAPASEAGDWWLSLPADVDSNKRESINDDELISGYEGLATNDLIDADGNRVIEVGSFTLRFVKGALKNAGERPLVAEDDCVTIENAETSSYIKMKKDGSIEIKGQGITLDADGKDIVLRGSKVKVE